MAGNRTADRAHRDRLVVEHYPLLRKIAGRMYRHVPRHMIELSELVSAGALGLIDAAVKFDPTLSDNFGNYAELRIRGAILDELRERDPLSRDRRKLNRKIVAGYEDLSVKLGRRPTDEEVASSVGIHVADLQKNKLGSLTVMMDVEIADKVGDLPVQEDPESNILKSEKVAILKKLLRKLPERTRKIIILHYFRFQTLKQIARQVGVTESRICQIHREVLRTFKEQLGSAADLI